MSMNVALKHLADQITQPKIRCATFLVHLVKAVRSRKW
jgi:hypothetical protein